MNPRKTPDVIIFKNGWISPRTPAGRKGCGPRGGVQCVNEEAATAWADERKLSHQSASMRQAYERTGKCVTSRKQMRLEAK
jgi:hypothetical protein